MRKGNEGLTPLPDFIRIKIHIVAAANFVRGDYPLTLDDIYNAVQSIESLQPDWSYDTSDGTLNTEPYKICFFKETTDGLVSGSIMATESMASLDLRLYLGCTLKSVESDPYEFRYNPHVNAPNAYVTLAADSFFQRKGFSALRRRLKSSI